MKLGILSFSEKGFLLAQRLGTYLTDKGHLPHVSRCEGGGLSAWTAAHFPSDDALIFIGSCGIAVRAIAPFVQSKTTDPAVVVIDEQGTFCVSLLSGHLGGANALTELLAAFLGAVPVITTATDRGGVFAIDTWAQTQGLFIVNPERIKTVSARLLEGRPLRLKSDFPLQGTLPPYVHPSDTEYDVVITTRADRTQQALQLIAPVLSLGVGCRRGISADALEEAFALLLARSGCHAAAVEQACTISLKAREAGLLAFCQAHGLPLRTYPADALAAVPGSFTGSAFVCSVTGVDNVCERAAVLGSGGQLLYRKLAENGVTMALAMRPYFVTFEG